jgi:DNA-binding CsgD family transcriptional regulator
MLPTLPLVGRTVELSALHAALDAAGAGRGGALILSGESGVGKTRLLNAMAEEARRRGWAVAAGRAFPLETGVPYALFSEAFLPLLRGLDSSALAILARGGEAELAQLLPGLGGEEGRVDPRAPGGESPAELKTRLVWNFAQFLRRFAAKQPLLVVLEDLHWADASSLELLHFTVRQVPAERILFLCSYVDAEREKNAALRAAETSLTSLGTAKPLRLQPLSREATDELVRRAFGVDEAVVREFTALLYGWTRGNAFFLDETLKALVETGRLRKREGTWLGWEVEALTLPASVREAVTDRLGRVGGGARAVADLLAVTAGRASYGVLRVVSGLADADLLAALDELRDRRVVLESLEGDAVVYEFSHPIMRETAYASLGLGRTRVLHGAVATALEAHYGERAVEHADELAYHFARGDAGELTGKAVKYLVASGQRALARYANREAADYLGAALDRAERAGDVPTELLDSLARARQRLGEYEAAVQLWERVLAAAESAGDAGRAAAVRRRLGLAWYWSGANERAMAEYAAALAAARTAGDAPLEASIRIALGASLQEVGRSADAAAELQAALAVAERLADPVLLARVHRALLLLHVWTGPPERAREHGERAVELATASGDMAVLAAAEWGLAVLSGLTGNEAALRRHVAACDRLADELRSPLLRLWTAEIAIEYASGSGDWEAGIALGERTIALARALNQRTLLPRILVWTALMYLGRGDLERGRGYVDEAWAASGAGRATSRPMDVHTVVPAHTGLAAYHLAAGEYDAAIQVGEAGLAIADSTGYTIWAIYRLLPVLAEAYIWKRDFEGAARIGRRLHDESSRMGHPLGLAWAEACDGVIAWMQQDLERAVVLLDSAATALEAIPWPADAARLRRQLAGRLADLGDREGALRELRRAHEVLSRLGAERELAKARDQFRELGARPPARSGGGAAGLTGRELEIARMAAERKSNKAIGRALGISPRTVGTHLSNIFRKLEVESRAELVDLARQGGMPEA